jgi:hypothetical protein
MTNQIGNVWMVCWGRPQQQQHEVLAAQAGLGSKPLLDVLQHVGLVVVGTGAVAVLPSA